MDRYLHVTIGELLEIKKIIAMTAKEGLYSVSLSKIDDIKDKYKFTSKEVQNLMGIANNFEPILILE